MTTEQYLKNLSTPTGKIDVILDTDTFNEADDQVALAYMLKCDYKLNIKGITAAPYSGPGKVDTPKEGVINSYNEILHILSLTKREDLNDLVFMGAENYLSNENTPVDSDAAEFMANLANNYTPENPLYIVAIGAITNVASAILKNPQMKENCVVVWLGGHALHYTDTREFNMLQDVSAARVVFGCGVPLVQLPCHGVVSEFTVSQYELEHWLGGKSELCDYFIYKIVKKAESYAKGLPWAKPLWDVTAIGWLLNDDDKYMLGRLIQAPIPQYDNTYSDKTHEHKINYIYKIKRNDLMGDLFSKLGEYK
jgi:inosine-uridine nucleoside N-ribohydrolase